MFTIGTVSRANIGMSRIITKHIRDNVPDMHELIQNVHARIRASSGSRCTVYHSINPDLKIYSIYGDRHTEYDLFRISFTRFRVSGHSLCVETGRWKRRCWTRLPMEEQLCVCGEVQTEKHVVEECPVALGIRQTSELTTMKDLFNGKFSFDKSCQIVHNILQLYG